MTPKNNQIIEQVKQINLRLDDTGQFLENVAFALAMQYKFIADRMPGLSESERDLLKGLARQAQDGVEKHKAARKLFQDSLSRFSQN
jgi:hypothetical protein